MSAPSRVRSVPMEYRGYLMRSTLEADIASNFDDLGWYWTYEPIALQVDGHAPYLCDFHLPTSDVWVEVKGPHNERLNKARELAGALESHDLDLRKPLVVIMRPAGPGSVLTWESGIEGMDIVIAHCPSCDAYGFLDLEGVWLCRNCYYGQGPGHDNKFWRANYYRSGELPFQRAPRPRRAA